MAMRIWIGVTLIAVIAGFGGPAAAQEDDRRALARELARLMLDDARGGVFDEQVAGGMMRAVAANLEQRLNRNLLEVEWQVLTGLVRRFVREALPPDRVETIATEIYMRHFDAGELREIVAFQRSPVGRKTARLTSVIASDTFRAIDREMRTSPAMPGLMAELQRMFPVLGSSESP